MDALESRIVGKPRRVRLSSEGRVCWLQFARKMGERVEEENRSRVDTNINYLENDDLRMD